MGSSVQEPVVETDEGNTMTNKMSAVEKKELQDQLDYAQRCHDNTAVAEARTYWANMVRMYQKALQDGA